MRRSFMVAAAVAVAAFPAIARADANDDLTKAAVRSTQARSWHVEITASQIPITGDYVAPDRFHMTMPFGSSVIIGKTSWAQMFGGKWVKQTSSKPPDFFTDLRSAANGRRMTQGKTVRDLGPSSVGGIGTHAYGVDETKNGKTTHEVIDVGVADGYVHRIRVTSGGSTATVIYSRYNEPIKIEPPV